MSVLARIRANGGGVIRHEWTFALQRGRLTDAAVAWLRSCDRWRQACREAWAPFDEWEERAAILEHDAKLPRHEADERAYREIVGEGEERRAA